MSRLITIRLPDELLESVDAMAKAEGMNRSQTIIALLRDGDLSPVVAVVQEPPHPGIVVPVSRDPKSKPSIQIQPVTTTCKCGGTGVMIVGGKRKCATCGRELGA
jgi:hypothetical protein